MTPEQFKAIRKSLKLTQAQLGRVIGCNAKTIYNWEKGHWPVPKAEALAMRFLEVWG